MEAPEINKDSKYVFKKIKDTTRIEHAITIALIAFSISIIVAILYH